jgi:phenylalanyl-tRNA synthetase alpha chain
MDATKIVNSLHPLERAVLPLLAKTSTFSDIVAESKLQDVEVMRALQWLQNKELIEIKEDLKEIVELDDNGKSYVKDSLPERRVLDALKKRQISINEVPEKANITQEELGICIGVLKQKAAIIIDRGVIDITGQGEKLLEKKSLEELFLEKLASVGHIELKNLADEERYAFETLKSRKRILKVSVKKLRSAYLTDLGKQISRRKIDAKAIEKLTPEMIKTGAWKRNDFRTYDIKINVPPLYGGRKQHYRKFLDGVRNKFQALGFKEMTGPLVESDFWDMDALYMPQFHSARDIHQAYYIKEPKLAKLDEKIVERVKKSHENGFGTGSTGWKYEFDVQRTRRMLLRTQGTACSARMLASKDLKIPGKYFGLTRCFRYDVIDATHNVDFYQTEGIVAEEGLNFRHLKGILKMFAEEFAQTSQIKIRPGYFPFTEPSAELHAKHPELGWIELGGSGIFRPEMTKALGVDVPVIAWGIGIDRIAMINLGIKDIRKLFSHDIDFLRKARFV